MTTYAIADPCPHCKGSMLRGECVACSYSRQDEAEAAETRALMESGAIRLNNRESTHDGHTAGDLLKATMTAEEEAEWAKKMRTKRYLDGDQPGLL